MNIWFTTLSMRKFTHCCLIFCWLFVSFTVPVRVEALKLHDVEPASVHCGERYTAVLSADGCVWQCGRWAWNSTSDISSSSGSCTGSFDYGSTSKNSHTPLHGGYSSTPIKMDMHVRAAPSHSSRSGESTSSGHNSHIAEVDGFEKVGMGCDDGVHSNANTNGYTGSNVAGSGTSGNGGRRNVSTVVERLVTGQLDRVWFLFQMLLAVAFIPLKS